MDPIVIMRNQDVREVLQTIVAKLRRRRANSQNNLGYTKLDRNVNYVRNYVTTQTIIILL